MKINIIVANCFFGGIGKSNRLPFSFSQDMKYFSKITKGNNFFSNGLLMGRNTWDSLPKKPLPYRHNYVISNTMKGDFVYKDIDSCLDFCKQKNNLDNLWIIGGEKIYNEFIFNEKYSKQVDYIYMTKIFNKYDCDKFFPVNHVCNGNNWNQISCRTDIENRVQLEFAIYENLNKEKN